MIVFISIYLIIGCSIAFYDMSHPEFIDDVKGNVSDFLQGEELEGLDDKVHNLLSTIMIMVEFIIGALGWPYYLIVDGEDNDA